MPELICIDFAKKKTKKLRNTSFKANFLVYIWPTNKVIRAYNNIFKSFQVIDITLDCFKKNVVI